jgi:hypothetical protein
VPQSGNGGQPGGHGHDPVPALGNASGAFLQLAGHGVTVGYTQHHLKVTWESGATMTMRSPERWITAHVDHIHLAGNVVMLTLKAQVPVPDPWFSQVDIVLAFPGSLEEDVRQLAARLHADREDSGSSAAGKPDPAPPMPPPPHRHDPWNPQPAEPARARAHDRPPPAAPARTGYPAELPAVAFQADLATWADDPDWIGLYPSFETIRLIVGRPLRQSHEAGSPPSA